MSVFKIGASVKHSGYPGIVWEIIGPGAGNVHENSYHCKVVASTAPGYPVGFEFNALFARLLTLAEPQLTVATTGIVACKDAHSKGFRVQCLHKGIGDYIDLTSPQWDADKDSYRIHPDDVPKYVAWYNGQHVEPVSPPQPVSTTRPHAELIKAWADGAEIEVFYNGKWVNCARPEWVASTFYRVKPQPAAKPKIPRAVFDKAAARRKAKYNARINKLVDQITALHEQKAAIAEHYVEKQRRAGVFAKEHVE